MGVNVLLREERIFAWHRIPKSSRTVLISTLIIIVFLTPNLAEGYESTWYKIDLDSEEHYNDALIDSNGDAWIFGDNGIIVFGEELTNWSLIETVTSEDLLTAYSNENLVVAAGTNGTVIYKTIPGHPGRRRYRTGSYELRWTLAALVGSMYMLRRRLATWVSVGSRVSAFGQHGARLQRLEQLSRLQFAHLRPILRI